MRKALLVLGVMALLGGLVFAKGSFVLDDSNFDYFDRDDGYIALDFADGVFTLSFSDSADADMAAAVGDIEFLPLDEDEDFSQASMRRFLPVEITNNSAEIFHTDATLDEVMASYDSQLTGLGFTSTADHASSNSTVMLYEQGDTTARVVYTRLGEDVKVSMSAL